MSTITATGSENCLALGTRLSDFEITGVLGEGGFGIVYMAFDHALQRSVAIKEYMPGVLATRGADHSIKVRAERHQETFNVGLKSFINEARFLAQFDHPSLVKVHRFWEQNQTAYTAMQYYDGRTIKDIVTTSAEQVNEAWCRKVMKQILDALEMLYTMTILHRDVSPDNIIVQENGDAVLLDFGSARQIIGDRTRGLTVILKPGYAPVEQYAGDASLDQGPYTDIYALSAVMYFAIVKEAPATSIARMVKDPIKPLAERGLEGYSRDFLAAIDKGLSVLAQDRPQTIDAFRALLGIEAAEAPRPRTNGPAQRFATIDRLPDPVSAPPAAAVPAPAAEPFVPAAPVEASAPEPKEQVAVASTVFGNLLEKAPAKPLPPSLEKAADNPFAQTPEQRIEKSASQLADKLAEKSADNPANKSADKLAERLAQMKAELKVDKSAEKASEKPAERGSEKAASRSNEKVADKAGDKSADKPADKAGDKPADKSSGKGGERSAQKSGSKPGSPSGAASSKPKVAGPGKGLWAIGGLGALLLIAGLGFGLYKVMGTPAGTVMVASGQTPALPDAAPAAATPTTPPVAASAQTESPLAVLTEPETPAAATPAVAAAVPAGATPAAAAATTPAVAGAAPAAATPAATDPAAPTAAEALAGATDKPAEPEAVSFRLAIKPWGTIYVDGKEFGVTPPMKALKLPSGKHKIRIVNPSFPDYNREIDTTKTKSRTIDYDFSARAK